MLADFLSKEYDSDLDAHQGVRRPLSLPIFI
jgi:hypothetical protein